MWISPPPWPLSLQGRAVRKKSQHRRSVRCLLSFLPSRIQKIISRITREIVQFTNQILIIWNISQVNRMTSGVYGEFHSGLSILETSALSNAPTTWPCLLLWICQLQTPFDTFTRLQSTGITPQSPTFLQTNLATLWLCPSSLLLLKAYFSMFYWKLHSSLCLKCR